MSSTWSVGRGELADEDVAAGVDAALGFGGEHGGAGRECGGAVGTVARAKRGGLDADGIGNLGAEAGGG